MIPVKLYPIPCQGLCEGVFSAVATKIRTKTFRQIASSIRSRSGAWGGYDQPLRRSRGGRPGERFPSVPPQTIKRSRLGDAGCVMLFVKAPRPGRVKTRLTGALDPYRVCRLYQCFVEDLFCRLQSAGHPLQIHYHPAFARRSMEAWLGRGHHFQPQAGAHLGRRMANAFDLLFNAGWQRGVLVGGDLPDLPGEFIHEAFTALKTRDAVIGPAQDGGYYLIGFNAPGYEAGVFQGISWGTPAVFGQSLGRLRDAGRRVHLLPAWRDIDDEQDLQDFIRLQGCMPGAAPRTIAFLKRLGRIPPGPADTVDKGFDPGEFD